jgi:hypothetical protein
VKNNAHRALLPERALRGVCVLSDVRLNEVVLTSAVGIDDVAVEDCIGDAVRHRVEVAVFGDFAGKEAY